MEVENELTKLLNGAGIQHGEYNVELYYTSKNELFTIEINARQGGNMLPVYVEKHCGINLYKLLVTTAVNDQSYWEEIQNRSERTNRIICHHVLFPRKTGLVKGIQISQQISKFVVEQNITKKIKAYLNRRKKPDLVYAAVPSLAVAEVCADYCKAVGVKFIADIQDLWPEAFKMVVNVPIVSDIGFYPMKKQADKIYAAADEIIAVSETYAKRGMSVNRKCKKPTVVYLGTEKNTFDSYVNKTDDSFNGIVIGYIGSLAASYDLETVIDAIAKIATPVKFLVMGDGAYKERFAIYAKTKGIHAEFTGALDYPCMVSRLVNLDIAVNPIHRGSAGSIINKVNDYAMAGLPVVNTQESQEYRNLLYKYGAGLNCECENADEVYHALMKLIGDKTLREQMGNNSRRMGEEIIDRATSYQQIVKRIYGEEE